MTLNFWSSWLHLSSSGTTGLWCLWLWALPLCLCPVLLSISALWGCLSLWPSSLYPFSDVSFYVAQLLNSSFASFSTNCSAFCDIEWHISFLSYSSGDPARCWHFLMEGLEDNPCLAFSTLWRTRAFLGLWPLASLSKDFRSPFDSGQEYRHVPPCQVYMVLGNDPKASCMLGKHSTS